MVLKWNLAATYPQPSGVRGKEAALSGHKQALRRRFCCSRRCAHTLPAVAYLVQVEGTSARAAVRTGTQQQNLMQSVHTGTRYGKAAAIPSRVPDGTGYVAAGRWRSSRPVQTAVVQCVRIGECRVGVRRRAYTTNNGVFFKKKNITMVFFHSLISFSGERCS